MRRTFQKEEIIIEPFADTADQQLHKILNLVHQLYMDGEKDIAELKTLVKKTKGAHTSVRELLETEKSNNNQLMQIQETVQKLKQQLLEEFDPQYPIKK